jgi:hypothetical protein
MLRPTAQASLLDPHPERCRRLAAVGLDVGVAVGLDCDQEVFSRLPALVDAVLRGIDDVEVDLFVSPGRA